MWYCVCMYVCMYVRVFVCACVMLAAQTKKLKEHMNKGRTRYVEEAAVRPQYPHVVIFRSDMVCACVCCWVSVKHVRLSCSW